MDILQKVIELMKNSKNVSNKTELAKRLGKSKGFVSQLFSGDKILNLRMIAQLEEIFNSKFIPSFKDYSEYSSTKKFGIDDYTNYSDYELNKPIIYNLKDYPPVKAA
jgi:transcriptional regulator with XRE-family HTH domain